MYHYDSASNPSTFTNLMDSLFAAIYLNLYPVCFIIGFISPFIVFVSSIWKFYSVTGDKILTSAKIPFSFDLSMLNDGEFF